MTNTVLLANYLNYTYAPAEAIRDNGDGTLQVRLGADEFPWPLEGLTTRDDVIIDSLREDAAAVLRG